MGQRLAGTAALWLIAMAIVWLCLPDTTATAQPNPVRILEGVIDGSGVKNLVRKKKGKIDPKAIKKKGAVNPSVLQKKGPGLKKGIVSPRQPGVKSRTTTVGPKGIQPKGFQQKGVQPKTVRTKDGKDFRRVTTKGRDGKGKDLRATTVKGKDGKTLPGKKAKAVDGKSKVGKGKDGKTLPGKSAKAVDGKSKVGKGKDAASKIGKGKNGKTKAAIATPGSRKTSLTKAGPGGKAGVPKLRPTKGIPFRQVRRTPAQRRLFEVGHRRAIATARARLPRRLLPGDAGFTGVPPVAETRYVASDMMFGVGPNVSPQQVQAMAQRHGLTVVGSRSTGLIGETVYHLRFTGNRRVADVTRAMEGERIGLVQPNYVYRTQQDPPVQSSLGNPAAGSESAGTALGDPAQYVINKLRLAEVHRVTRGAGVLIAVIDSQIDSRHPDLEGAIIDQFDAVGTAGGAPHAHGTGMVGAIAAHRKLMGIAPGVKVLAVRAFSPDAQRSPQATTRHIIAGLDWAVGKGARVINMSFAGPYDPMLALAMKRAHEKGVVLIAASGNAGAKSPPLYPAADPHVIAVTATDEEDKLLPVAVRGPHVAVSAPGVDIMVPAPEEAYQLTTGTSVAAAHVSGVAALLIDRHPTASAATILEVLTVTARKLNPKGRDDQYGWGLVDPSAALQELDDRMAAGVVASAEPAGAVANAEPVPLPVPRPTVRRQPVPKAVAPIRLTPAPASAR
ncbi:MAG: S8 family peptidase [Xanthobacteraceae bacterium]